MLVKRLIGVCLVVLFVAGVAYGARTRRRPARPRPDNWNVSANTGLAYDDNVFQYSDEDIATFESGERPERFGFASIGDFFQTTEVEAERRLSRRRRTSTYLEARVRSRVYLRDDEENNVRYQLSLRQVNRGSSWTRLRLTYLPSFFVRRLRDVETHEFLPAEFDYLAVQLTHSRELSPHWSAQGDLTWARRDYNRAFDERDNSTWGVQLEARYEPDPRWDIWLGYELNSSQARARDAFPDVDVDISNRENVWTVGARYAASRRDSWSVKWRHGQTAFTTDLSPADDPFHAGRHDNLDVLSLEWRRKLSKRHTLELEWRHERQRSNLSPDAETHSGEDSLSYDRNVYALRYSTAF